MQTEQDHGPKIGMSKFPVLLYTMFYSKQTSFVQTKSFSATRAFRSIVTVVNKDVKKL